MKNVLLLLLVFAVGDCIILQRGVFKGSYWTILKINADSTFDLQDRQWILRDVRGSYLYPAVKESCKEK